MRFLFLAAIFLYTSSLLAQQSIASVKSGLIWTDIFDDGQLLAQHQKGYTLGFDVRLGAQDPTYFLLGAFFTETDINPNDRGGHFAVKNGYSSLKALCGLESRLYSHRHLNWRLGLGCTFHYVANVKGTVEFEDLSDGLLGLQLKTGIDLHFVTLDLSAEYGFSNLLQDSEKSKPFSIGLELGFNFR